jgi:sterol-4alpha-carboxylate 3-dehydrogenase (decarboxylating)
MVTITSGERSPLSLSTVLVTGGSGGLASRILQLFSQRGCEDLHSIDLRHPLHCLDGITYHVGDLTDSDAMRRIFQNIKPNVVIHTASPKFDTPNHIMYKVNVDGTKTLIQIAKEFGTESFIYTSSASVVSDAVTDLRNADESFPVILDDSQPEFYVHTKALAETYVLSQNCRTQGSTHQFLTCAIRPSGIFGFGDLVVLPGILDAYFRGQTKVQIGNNLNLFDFTENTNVAHAHYLAAVALARYHTHLPRDDVRVDGEAFFVTNDESRYFWDFTRLVWGYAGDTTRPEQVWVITKTWALLLAGLLEWTFWALRLGEPPLTRTKVRLSCMTRHFCIDKAKKRLGYAPLVGLEEGLKQAVEDCVRRREAEKSTATVTQKDL